MNTSTLMRCLFLVAIVIVLSSVLGFGVSGCRRKMETPTGSGSAIFGPRNAAASETQSEARDASKANYLDGGNPQSAQHPRVRETIEMRKAFDGVRL